MHYAICNQPGKVAYFIVSASDPRASVAANSTFSEGVVFDETLAGIAEKLGINVENLEETAAAYIAAIAGEVEDAFGVPQENLLPMEAPYYAFPMHSFFPGTYSGFVVGDHCEILGTDGQPIPNLYGVGETALGMGTLNNALFSGAIAGADAANQIISGQ